MQKTASGIGLGAVTRKSKFNASRFQVLFQERFGQALIGSSMERDILPWREQLRSEDLALSNGRRPEGLPATENR